MDAALPLALALALGAGGGATDPLPWDGESYRRYADDAARLALPVPLTQALVESRHFPQARPGQMTDWLLLSGPEGVELEVGVWRNPAGLALGDWVKAYAGYLLSTEGVTLDWQATPARVPARLFEHPRTGQQFARRTAVFAVGGRVVQLTCPNRDHARAAALFEKVLAELELEP